MCPFWKKPWLKTYLELSDDALDNLKDKEHGTEVRIQRLDSAREEMQERWHSNRINEVILAHLLEPVYFGLYGDLVLDIIRETDFEGLYGPITELYERIVTTNAVLAGSLLAAD